MALDGNLDHSQSEVCKRCDRSIDIWTGVHAICQMVQRDIKLCIVREGRPRSFATRRTSKQKPIPAPGLRDRSASWSMQRGCDGRRDLVNAQSGLIFKSGWPELGFPPLLQGWAVLGQAIYEALHGNATLFSFGTCFEWEQCAFGAEAVACLDWMSTTSRSLAQVKYKAQLGAVIAPNTQQVTGTLNHKQLRTDSWGVFAVVLHRHTMSRPAVQAGRFRSPIHQGSESEQHSADSYYQRSVWSIGFIRLADNLMEHINSVVLLTRARDRHTSYFLMGRQRERSIRIW